MFLTKFVVKAVLSGTILIGAVMFGQSLADFVNSQFSELLQALP